MANTPSSSNSTVSSSSSMFSFLSSPWLSALGGAAAAFSAFAVVHHAAHTTRSSQNDKQHTDCEFDTSSCNGVSPSIPASYTSIPLGAPIRSLFSLNSSTVFLNHGSYGVAPKAVSEAQQYYQQKCERHCDTWFRQTEFPMLQDAIKEVASFINAPASDVVFVPNATAGVNAVLLSLIGRLKSGDILFTLQTTYNACKLAMQHTADRTGAKYVEQVVKFPLESEEKFLKEIEATFDSPDNTGKIRFALFDVITSPTSIVMPYKRLAQMCSSRNILCFLDGAHAIGQLPLDLSSFECDFLTTNLHKWLFAPKSSAILYVKSNHQNWIHPLITSHSHRENFQKRFWMQGTRDSSAYLGSTAAIQFVKTIGVEKIFNYNTQLADWAENYLSERWNVKSTPFPPSASSVIPSSSSSNFSVLCPPGMKAPYMRIVPLPLTPPPSDLDGLMKKHSIDRWTACKIYADEFLVKLMEHANVVVAVLCLDGTLYVRFSAQIYNTKEDYQKLANVILEYKKVMESK